jgi:hypothetical protein
VEWRFALQYRWSNSAYLRLEANRVTIWNDSDSGCLSCPVFLLFRSATPCSSASRLSMDLCFEQTRESSQLQLGRVEKSRSSFIGDCIGMSDIYQIIVKLSWAVETPASRLHREN